MAESRHYTPSSEDEDFETEKQELLGPYILRQKRKGMGLYVVSCLLAVSLIANVGLLLKNAWWKPPMLYCKKPSMSLQLAYVIDPNEAPANEVLQDKLVSFGSSVKGTGFSDFQGSPNERNNKLWRSLYKSKISDILQVLCILRD